ncbi:Dbl homology domain-containing protein [Chlamydoabsidia padenii]|nr:Dbl homology domain-containing protein [Chlamydoabsidia padenii]
MYYDGVKHQNLLDVSLASPVSDIGSASTSSSSQSMSFYVDQNVDSYHQLMDDLSIIDDIYNSYDHEQLNLALDNQVAYSTKNGALKQQMVQHLIQTESQFIDDLYAFHTHFATKMPQFHLQKTKLAFQPSDCAILFNPTASLISVHQDLLDELQQRLSIYGPTQITSDIFQRFFENMHSGYISYLNSFSTTLLTLDRLHKTNPFVKFLESCHQSAKPLQEFGYYIRLPLTRLNVYTQTVVQCTQLTEPGHPDYNALVQISQQYKARQQQWQALIDNCLSHYRVYECFRLVQHSPALVTPTRRLLLHSELIHIDPSTPTDMSDRRIYILYNDMLIFCKQQKDGKLTYKGTVVLDKTVLRPMDTKITNKIYEKHQKMVTQQQQGGRKLSLFGMKKNQETTTRQATRTSTVSSSASSSTSSSTEEFCVYGIEFFFQYLMDNSLLAYTSPLSGYGGTVMSNNLNSDSLRRHIVRMKSLEEQQLWTTHLQQVIKNVSTKR